VTLHADAVRVLETWTAPDAAQDDLRRDYLAHLSTRPDAMERACHPDHLTASALVVDAAHERVLLTLHRRLQRWLQTGGHCETDDVTLAEAALREATEESGIDGLVVDPDPVVLSRHEVPCGPVRPAHHLDVQYVAVAPEGAVEVISDESSDLQWFAIDALPEGVDESVRTLVELSARRLRGTPEPAPSAGTR
jgi:8-oxo-dGTP pyrophosphatase MutT (NUDIX family)